MPIDQGGREHGLSNDVPLVREGGGSGSIEIGGGAAWGWEGVCAQEEREVRTLFGGLKFTVSGSTPTPWSGPFRDHGLRPRSQSPSKHRKP